MKSEKFSPKEFLKARRPERFSDTVFQEVTKLDRSLLEYHISSLTSRSQETDFERFAKRLCEYEICPNLLPQTGPTGGGDSKVDSETYPVADDLALIWYRGLGREASNARWAFAFSAKADWRGKVQSDVKKIISTAREYKKIFFVTSQFVRDKVRAEVEDSLRNQHAIDVRILDRSWILDRVFAGRHEMIAIEELRVTGLTNQNIAKGSQDIKREDELIKIEKRIQEAIQANNKNFNFVDDVLNVANLVRSLERPRTEIEGYFARAKRVAEKYGSLRQKVEAEYQWAWTLHWWFEDFELFAKQYVVVEELTKGSFNAYDLEQLTNLWMCLFSSVRNDLLNFDYDTHTNNLLSELKRLQGEEDRPSTTLTAETLYIQIQLVRTIANNKSPDNLLIDLREIVQKSKGLIGYPLESLVKELTEIGSAFEGSQAYDELFETIIEIASTRDGEIRAAKLLLKRGDSQIRQERYVEAIATLGRSLRSLYKHETRYDAVYALYLCGCAYEEMGLLWAARGTLLSAASIATNEYWKYEEIIPHQAACYHSLKWIEIRLGRLPHLLSWHELDIAIRHLLIEQGYELETDSSFEIFLGRLLLKTEFFDLKYLETLPTILDQLGLDLASDALLYALGYEERLEEVAQNLDIDPLHFVSSWLNIQSDIVLPNAPQLYNRQKETLYSNILGCQITISGQNKQPCIEVAESLLAALESLLATSIVNHAVSREPKLTIDVKISDFAESLISFNREYKDGSAHFVVNCRVFNPHKASLEKQEKIREGLFKLTIAIMAEIVFFKDYEQDLQALFHEEKASERAFDFTGSFGTIGNILGYSPKTSISAWVEGIEQTYPILRTEPWKPIASKTNEKISEPFSYSKVTEQISSSEQFDPTILRHDKMETVSLIREHLWNQAGWSGVAFMVDPTNEYPPTLALIFTDKQFGREIFTQWQKVLGKIDKQEKLRITIVKGISIANPYAYRVIVGSNPELTNGKWIVFINRVNTMNAKTSDNLTMFLNSHSVVDAFWLAPAFVSGSFDGSQIPEFENELGILIHSVNVRNAWEIGLNDVDIVGIHKGDKPIIPEGIENIPVHDLLKEIDDK